MNKSTGRSKEMQSKTAIAEQLEAKGITARIVAIRMAIALHRNHGGTYEELMAEVNAAWADEESRYSSAGRMLSERSAALRMGSEGQLTNVEDGHRAFADASRPDAAKGHLAVASDADGKMPDAATQRSAGQYRVADKAAGEMPVASPRRSRADRLASGANAVEHVYRKSLFDTYRLFGDGRPIGDVTWKELTGIARKSAETFRLTSLISGYAEADPDALVRDVLKEDTLKEFIEIARLSNVH